MKCPACETELTNNETFCTNCGKRVDGAIDTPTGVESSNTNTENNNEQPAQQTEQPAQNVQQPAPADNAKYNSVAISGFVISIVSIFVVSIILGPVGAIFSAIGLKQINETNEKGKGLAIAGIIIGISVIILMIIGYATGIVGTR